jgi:hypothetical protein
MAAGQRPMVPEAPVEMVYYDSIGNILFFAIAGTKRCVPHGAENAPVANEVVGQEFSVLMTPIPFRQF